MENWFLCFFIKTFGVSSIGESMGEPPCLTQEIKIHLRDAFNEKEATNMAKIIWSNKGFGIIPPEYRKGIKRGDNLEFINPKVVYEGERFEKALF